VVWTAVFVARPFVWPPWGQSQEYGWTPVDHVLGNAYVLAALALSVWAAASLRRLPPDLDAERHPARSPIEWNASTRRPA